MTRLSGLLKSRILTTPNAGYDVKQQELLSLLVGTQHGRDTVGDSLAFSQ